MSDESSRLENETWFVDDDSSVKHPERNDEGDSTPVPPPEPEPEPELEEEMITKKYGGLLRRKPPLISQDHERAFFDSADWALAKQGPHKQARGPLEPKLQPSPHQQMRSRRSAYAPLSTEGDTGSSSNAAQSDESDKSKDGGGEVFAPEKEISQEGRREVEEV